MKSIVVLSGGQDSTTTLAYAATRSQVVGLIHFDYGQRHAVERQCAEYWASRFGLELCVIPISSLSALGNSALVDGGDVSAAHPTLAHLPASFVPGRNLVFLTLAAAYAMKQGATQVYTGVCQEDYSGYPDCRQDTIDALEQAVQLGMDFPELELCTPIMNVTKAQTFALAADLGVLEDVLEHSHTCYNGDHSNRHEWGYGCGACPACSVRANGWDAYRASL